MLYVMFQGIYKLGVTMLVPIDLFVSLIGLVFYYLSKYKNLFHYLRSPLLVVIFLAEGFFWFQLGGYFGPGAIGAVVAGISAIVLAPYKKQLTYFLLSSLFILSLIYIQLNTDWVTNIEATKQTMHLNYLLFAFAGLLIVYYVKKEFDKERRLSEKQNVHSTALNKLLENTIKDREKVIDKLKSTRDRLIEAEKMASIGRFTAGLAHELNNPLNFIGGSVWPIRQNLDEVFNTLTEEQLKAKAENLNEINNLLQNIKDGTSQAKQVMDGLLKISPTSIAPQSDEINLSDLLKNVTKFFQSSNPNIYFNQEIEKNIKINGFLVEINQVLVNLIKNSIDAISSTESPEINIRLTQNKEYAKIEVEDSGPGIPENELSHIFEPFFTTKPQGTGTGVGLYISFTIANKHGGDLKYKTLKKGALFVFTLPILKQKP
jgi:signal transduction histidine kinase